MISREKILNSGLYALAASIFVTILVFLYTTFIPYTVLQNWSINIADKQNTYQMGDKILVQSIYTKTKAITGVANRHLECSRKGLNSVTYDLSSAAANHAPGTRTGTGVEITIPPLQTPSTCVVAIDVSYKPYPGRTVTQYAKSDSFNVIGN